MGDLTDGERDPSRAEVAEVAEVLAWAQVQVGCRADDEGCQPVLWCRLCGDLPPQAMRQVRGWWGLGRPGYVCARCGRPVVPTPF
jgi:hypothetical protein